jgi:hypothetical protein
MLKNALSRPLAVGLSLAPLAIASAQSAPSPAYVFTAVDSVEIKDSGFTFTVKGMVQGESAARTVELHSTFFMSGYEPTQGAVRCERMALVAMNKPGRFLFEVQQEDSGFRCKLTRLP